MNKVKVMLNLFMFIINLKWNNKYNLLLKLRNRGSKPKHHQLHPILSNH